MKLRNKKTGEIRNAVDIDMYTDSVYLKVSDGEFGNGTIEYHSLAELNSEWEDVPEEPKDFWFIDPEILIACESTDPLLCDKKVAIETMKQIGNYFSSKEEAEKTLEKLKAWKRLNKCGFRFEGYNNRDRANGGDIVIYAHVDIPNNNLLEEAQPAMLEDLALLFGGEE